METTNNSDKSNDEPNAKRPKIEPQESASSIPEAKDPFLSLPSDIHAKIIAYIPLAQWPALELLSHNFRDTTMVAWRQVRNVNLVREFVIKSEQAEWLVGKCFKSILQKLVERSPFVTSLCGIYIQWEDTELNSDVAQLLAKFNHLESITIGDAKLFNDEEEEGIPLDIAVEFLESTRSRTCLKELRLINVFQWPDNREMVLDRFSSSFVTGREIQSSLKLEKFSFASSDPVPFVRLDTLDTTRLTDVRLGKATIEHQQLISLIERASYLHRIELAFLSCDDSECDRPKLQDNKKLLIALASHQNLTAIKIDSLGDACNCTDFKAEFIEMLKSIGRRGQLRKLALGEIFASASEAEWDEVCSTIRNYIPTLRSIKLDVDLSKESVFHIVSLAELEEIHCTHPPMTIQHDESMRKIARLPHLKRLAIDVHFNTRDESLRCLADSKSLMDLRLGATSIQFDVFLRWSDGFAKNLEILMLSGINEEKGYVFGLIHLLKKTVKLRVLILDGRVTDRILEPIAKSCPKLETLGVRSISNEITVRHLQEIVDHCPRLKMLGGFGDELRDQLQFPKYRKISNVVDMEFSKYDFDDNEYD